MLSCLQILEAFLWFVLFVFHAEDGIRDADVTEVQTCALPIWEGSERRRSWDGAGLPFFLGRGPAQSSGGGRPRRRSSSPSPPHRRTGSRRIRGGRCSSTRSEESRVGKVMSCSIAMRTW